MRWFTQEQLNSTGLGRAHKGGPMYVLLEYYVLDRIGHLPAGLSVELDKAVPEVYDGGPSWIECVRHNLSSMLPPDDQLRAMWKKHQQTASRENRLASPDEFAREIVSQEEGRGCQVPFSPEKGT